MKRSGIFLSLAVWCCNNGAVPFTIKNSSDVAIAFATGTKSKGVMDILKLVEPGETSSETNIDLQQPVFVFHMKNHPEMAYRYEIINLKPDQKVELQFKHSKLEPASSLNPFSKNISKKQISLLDQGAADKLSKPFVMAKPHVIQDKKPAAKPMGPLMQAIVRGDSLREIKAMAASGKITAKDFNEKDEYGNSVLTVAEELWREDAIIDFLKSKGAK